MRARYRSRRRRCLIAAGFLAFPAAVAAADWQGPYFGVVQRVIDGDTFEAEVSIWPTIRAVVSVRLAGIDAPEVFRPACPGERELGTVATGILRQELHPGDRVRLENVTVDPFPGRVAAEVFRMADQKGTSLGVLLTKPSRNDWFARWSPGDPDIDWCEVWWRQKQKLFAR